MRILIKQLEVNKNIHIYTYINILKRKDDIASYEVRENAYFLMCVSENLAKIMRICKSMNPNFRGV